LPQAAWLLFSHNPDHHAAANKGVEWWQAVRLPSQQIVHIKP
jgi:hypothetical protein